MTKLLVAALPYSDFNISQFPSGLGTLVSSRGIADFQFRIMPVGASIVNGVLSSDLNGFRYGLRNQLVADGARVNMVGSRNEGTMLDSEVILS